MFILITDKNGYFSTKDNRSSDSLEEDEAADNTRKQNPFDDLLTKDNIKTADLEKRGAEIRSGVWFGTGEFKTLAAMNGNYGALPYDTYTIEEMPCETNKGYTLQKFQFTVNEKSQNGKIDLETITDDIPEIGTEASVAGKNADVKPNKQITLTDTISYTGLTKGKTYTAKGTLMDKATGEAVKDAKGNAITSEKQFTVHASSGKVKVTFTFDGSRMFGKETVVFENCDSFVYLGGNEQATHKYVSELLGKETIDTNTYGRSSGRNGNYSTNWQIAGRELMTPDEVRMLDNQYALLFIRGERPVKDLKYELLKHPNIALTEDGGAEPYIHGTAESAVGTILMDEELLDAAKADSGALSENGKYELLSEEDVEELFAKERAEEAAQKEEVGVQP